MLGTLFWPDDVTETLNPAAEPGGDTQKSEVLVRTVKFEHGTPPIAAVLPAKKLVPTMVKGSPPATAPGCPPTMLATVGVGAT